jgi:hypothetical protein
MSTHDRPPGPSTRIMTTVVRQTPTRIMTTEAEKQELVRAAQKLDTPLSTFIREAALEKARSEAAARPDWASFFARDFGIPSDWTLEREQPEDRDVFAGHPASSHEASSHEASAVTRKSSP